MSKPRTHYDNLKIHPDAPDAVIRAAYKALSQQHHPDKQSPADKEEAERIMRIINEARDVLLDPIKRKAYDEKILKEQSFEEEARKQREAEAKSRDEELRRQQTNENHGHQKQSVTYGDYFKAMTTLLNDASKVVLDPIKHKAYAEKILREQAAADEAARKQREADA